MNEQLRQYMELIRDALGHKAAIRRRVNFPNLAISCQQMGAIYPTGMGLDD